MLKAGETDFFFQKNKMKISWKVKKGEKKIIRREYVWLIHHLGVLSFKGPGRSWINGRQEHHEFQYREMPSPALREE